MRSFPSVSLALSPLLFVACAEPPESDYGERLAALEAALAERDARIDTLESTVAELAAELSTVEMADQDAIDSLVSTVNGIDARVPDGEGMLATQASVDAEAEAREAAIDAEGIARNAAIAQAIADEAEARDNAIDAAIGGEEVARNVAIASAVSAEATARANADTAEASARASGDASLVAQLAGQSADISDLEGRVSAIEADYVRVSGDVTRSVADEAALLAALEEVEMLHLASGSTFTIELAPATVYQLYAALEVHHPDGGRIRIVGGDPNDPSSSILYFHGSDGVVVGEGSALGYLGDLTLMGDGSDADGLVVRDSSTVEVGTLVVTDFGDNGIEVNTGSSLVAETDATTVQVVSVGGVGVAVAAQSYAYLPELTVDTTGSHGVSIEYGSSVWIYGATVTDAGDRGIDVTAGSYANAYNVTVIDPAGTGFYANEGSFIQASYAESYNGASGFTASHQSGIDSDYAYSSINSTASGYDFLASYGSTVTAYHSTVVGGKYAYASLGSFVDARYASISGVGYGYWQRYNGFIHGWNATAAGVQTADLDNDITNFVFGQ